MTFSYQNITTKSLAVSISFTDLPEKDGAILNFSLPSAYKFSNNSYLNLRDNFYFSVYTNSVVTNQKNFLANVKNLQPVFSSPNFFLNPCQYIRKLPQDLFLNFRLIFFHICLLSKTNANSQNVSSILFTAQNQSNLVKRLLQFDEC